jgi:methylase of polypeptide subunit release factors
MSDTRETVLPLGDADRLGSIRLRYPEGTFAPSPATCATVNAVAEHHESLAGTGLDWGCGVGALAIAAARRDRVTRVFGLDLDESNVLAARANAALNDVEDKVTFAVADSFEASDPETRAALASLEGTADFLLANPPHSATNDGFDFRRRVLREGARFLRPGGVVLVQALSAYGPHRAEALAEDAYDYEGIAHRTALVPLDFERAQIRHQMSVYVKEERRGGRPYLFQVGADEEGPVSAHAAYAAHEAGTAVLARWQVHRFRRTG